MNAMMNQIRNVIKPQNQLEEMLLEQPDMQQGLLWGKPRDGHPEGTVLIHEGAVLTNVEKLYGGDTDYRKLRLIAIIHDSFKAKVDRTKARIGDNHHARIARRFAEKFCDEADVLEVIETHDDAYNAFCIGTRKAHQWKKAETRANELIARLQQTNSVELYLKFFLCDNSVEGKTSDSYDWFRNRITYK